MKSDKAATDGSEVDRAVRAGRARSSGRKRLLMRRRRMPVVLAGFITLLLLPILIFSFIVAGNYVIELAKTLLGMRSPLKWPSALDHGGLLLSITAALVVGERVFRRLRWRIFPYDGSICVGCGYSLRGSSTGVCPECGRSTRRDITRPAARDPTAGA